MVVFAATNLGALVLVPWRRRAFGGFPTARLNYLSLLSLFTENVPQIVVQVVNAEPARGGQGLGGVALVSVALSATAIVVKTLQKLFEGCSGEKESAAAGPRPFVQRYK